MEQFYLFVLFAFYRPQGHIDAGAGRKQDSHPAIAFKQLHCATLGGINALKHSNAPIIKMMRKAASERR